AWAFYNIKNSDDSVEKLLIVANAKTSAYSLRKEALKDLILFTSDFYKPTQMYPFFKKHTTDEEMVSIITDLSQLYQSYSRYEDSNLIIQQFQKESPLSPIAVRLEMALTDNYESMKKRDLVLKHIEIAQKHCQPKSEWATQNTQETYQESCNTKLKSFQAEITKKWWEIWEKNKKHKEFNEMMIGLLRIGIMNEDLAESDKKTRYLLAEVLFHKEKFEEASLQYQIVGDKSQEASIRHDSYYSALYSFEKHIGSPQSKDQLSKRDVQDRIYVLSQQYLTFSPQGIHNQQVRLKLAIIATEKKDYPEALKYLTEIKGTKDPELSLKCQDLQLEIYNIQKDYKNLMEFALSLQSQTQDTKRKKQLIQISKEAELNEILDSKDNEKLLLAYSEKNSDIQLGQEALWKVISENYKNHKVMTAAELSEDFAKKYPQDPRSQSALTEALNVYIKYGFFSKAIQVIQFIKAETSKKDYTERLGDYFRLENDYLKASEKYMSVLESTKPSNEDFQRLIEKLKHLSEKDSQVQLEKIYSSLIQKGVEPYITRHQIEKAHGLIQNKKYAEAFEAARKIMSRSVSNEEKFGARLIQAQVLENEFVSQSLKTSPSKLSLVLAIKTEKFDKAFTSFNEALR
ncbi:MAG: tetratricopeptide repeat protein, partial [Pseudobdellovibrionaceae bacterium]